MELKQTHNTVMDCISYWCIFEGHLIKQNVGTRMYDQRNVYEWDINMRISRKQQREQQRTGSDTEIILGI